MGPRTHMSPNGGRIFRRSARISLPTPKDVESLLTQHQQKDTVGQMGINTVEDFDDGGSHFLKLLDDLTDVKNQSG